MEDTVSHNVIEDMMWYRIYLLLDFLVADTQEIK